MLKNNTERYYQYTTLKYINRKIHENRKKYFKILIEKDTLQNVNRKIKRSKNNLEQALKDDNKKQNLQYVNRKIKRY